MAENAIQSLRGLVLSAPELRQLNPEWTDAMIEDYLTLFENLTLIANIVDQKQDILRTVVNVTTTDSPFTVNDVDQEYVFDTTTGDISCQLLPGVDGRKYRMTNVGTGGNKVVITPDGTEELFGATSENLYDAETLDMTFESVKGWW